MSEKKSLPPPATLNEAIYHQVHHSSKPAKVIAEALNVANSTLYSAANESIDGARFPVQWIPTIINTTGDYVVLDMLERLTGRVAVKVDAKRPEGSTLQDEAMRVTKELGDTCEAIRKALDPKGHAGAAITSDEKARIRKEAYELLKESARLWTLSEGL